jgi:hypothetical protein
MGHSSDCDQDVRHQMSRQLRKILFTTENALSATTFRALQDSLFLNSGESYSRVDVYAAHLITQPRAVPHDSIRPTSASPNLGGSDDKDEDDFYITEMKSLRSGDDIAKYQAKAPGFRAFFIRQRFSYSPLSISLELFGLLFARENISPQMKDYLIFYGARDHEVEIAPPVLRFHPLAWTRANDQLLGHECMYGLRFFEQNGRGIPQEPTTQWSLRQTAIYCRSCPSGDGNVWLFTTISPVAQRRLDAYVIEHESIGLTSPFEIHLLLLDTAIANWRFFLIALSAEIDEEVSQVAGTSSSDEGPVELFDANRRQHLIYLEEKVSTALLVSRATVETVEALSYHYDSERVYTEASTDNAVIAAGFAQQHRILKSTILRLETMKAKLQASAALLSSLLEQNSGHALEVLGQESRKENFEMRELSKRMHKLTEKATQDAAAVKVLTVMTLIYLPATVVSNFFSTSFVSTKSSPGSTGHIIVLDDWWIFVVVSVPLTVITLYIWWVWTRIKTHDKYPCWLAFMKATDSSTNETINGDLESGREKP